MMSSRSLVRTPVFLLLIAFLMSCSSSGSVGQTRYFPQDRYDIWAAAMAATDMIGARVISSNQTAGYIVARLSVDSIGGGVSLNISVSPETGGGEVQVSATEVGATEVDDLRREELKFFEDQYLDFVAQFLASARGRRGSSTVPRSGYPP